MFCCSGYQRKWHGLEIQEETSDFDRKGRKQPKENEKPWSNHKSFISQSYTIQAYNDQQNEQRKDDSEFNFDRYSQSRRKQQSDSFQQPSYAKDRPSKDFRSEQIFGGKKLDSRNSIQSDLEELEKRSSKSEPKRLFKLNLNNEQKESKLRQQDDLVQAQLESSTYTNITPKSNQSNQRYSPFNPKAANTQQARIQQQQSIKTSPFLSLKNAGTRTPEETSQILYTQSSEGNFMETLEMDKENMNKHIIENMNKHIIEKDQYNKAENKLTPDYSLNQSEAKLDSFLQNEHEIVARQVKTISSQNPKEADQQQLNSQNQILTRSQKSSGRISSQLVNQRSIPDQQPAQNLPKHENKSKQYDIQQLLRSSLDRLVSNDAQSFISEDSQRTDKTSSLSELDKLMSISQRSKSNSTFHDNSKQLLYNSQFDLDSKLNSQGQNSRVGLNSGVRKSTNLPQCVQDSFSKDYAYDNLVYESAGKALMQQQLEKDNSEDQHRNVKTNSAKYDLQNTLQDSSLLASPLGFLNKQNQEALKKVDSQVKTQIVDTYSKKPIMTYNTFNQVVDRLINGFQTQNQEDSFLHSSKSLDLPVRKSNSLDTSHVKDSLQNIISSSQSRFSGRQDIIASLRNSTKDNRNLDQSLDFAALNEIVTGDLKLYQNENDTIAGYMDSAVYGKDPDVFHNSQQLGSIKSTQTKLPISSNPDYSHFFSGTNHNINLDYPPNVGIFTNQSSKDSLNRLLQHQRSGSLRSSGRQLSNGREKLSTSINTLRNNIPLNSQSTTLYKWKSRDLEDQGVSRLTPMPEEASKQTGQEISPREISTSRQNNINYNNNNISNNKGTNIGKNVNDGAEKLDQLKNNVETQNEVELKNEVTHINVGNNELFDVFTSLDSHPKSSPRKIQNSNTFKKARKSDKPSAIPFVSAGTGINKAGGSQRRALFRQDPPDKEKSDVEISFRQQIHQKVERTTEQFESSISEFADTQNENDFESKVIQNNGPSKKSESQLIQEQLQNQGLLYNSSMGDTLKDLKSFQLLEQRPKTRQKKAWQQEIVNFASYDQSRVYNYDLPSARKLKVEDNTYQIEHYQPLSQQDLREQSHRASYNGLQYGEPKTEIFRGKSKDLKRNSSGGKNQGENSRGAKKVALNLNAPGEQQSFFQPMSQPDVRNSSYPKRNGKFSSIEPQTDINLQKSSKKYEQKKYFRGSSPNNFGFVTNNSNSRKLEDNVFSNFIQEISGNKATQLDFFIEDNTGGRQKSLDNGFELPSYSEMVAIDRGIKIP